MILGPSLSATTKDLFWHLCKVKLHKNDFIPVVDEVKDYRDFPTSLAFKHRYANSLTNWSQGWGTFAMIYKYVNKPDKGPDNLHLIELDLMFRNEGTENEPREIYRWRDYIWRTYDVRIGSMFFAPYEDEGYVLYIPDPEDPDIAHSIRLDEKGVPMEPSDLKGGGNRSPRDFDRIPSGSERHSSFQCWYDYFSELDSARVSFWGSDDKGNLYTYQKIKQF